MELCIYLSRTERKFVTVKTVTPLLWRKYQKSEELKLEMAMYEQVAEKMARNGEEMTIATKPIQTAFNPSSAQTCYD